MVKTDVWVPIYVGDYLADTSRLTTAQHGAYFLLILDYWRNGPPPDDNAVLATITKCSEQDWSIARKVLEQYFVVADGIWRHKRIDKELDVAKSKKSSAVSKAKTAAEARWRKPSEPGSIASSNAPSIPQAVLGSCPSPSPSEETNTPQPPRGGKRPAVELQTFLDGIKERGELFLPTNDPTRKYAQEVGITDEMLRMAFLKFKDRYADGQKRYKDWRKVFRDSVKNRWFRLWHLNEGTGQMHLTNDGLIAMKQFQGDQHLRRVA